MEESTPYPLMTDEEHDFNSLAMSRIKEMAKELAHHPKFFQVLGEEIALSLECYVPDTKDRNLFADLIATQDGAKMLACLLAVENEVLPDFLLTLIEPKP